jgi:hypothetical protein
MEKSTDQSPPKRGLYYVIPSAIMDSKELSCSEKLLYALLSGFSDDKGECFPSDLYLSERMNMQVRELQKIIKRLDDLGYISRRTESCSKNPFRKIRYIAIHSSFKKVLRNVSQAGIEDGVIGPVSIPAPGPVSAPTPGPVIVSEEIYLESEENTLSCPLTGEAPEPSGSSRPVGLTSEKSLLKKKKEKREASQEGKELAKDLWGRIQALQSTHKAPNLDKWAQEMDDIMRLDSRAPNELSEVIAWAFECDTFWCKTLRSPDGLRRGYDKIVGKMTPVENKGTWLIRNRALAYECQSNIKSSWQYKFYSVDPLKGVTRTDTGFLVSFDLEPKLFEATLCRVFVLERENG